MSDAVPQKRVLPARDRRESAAKRRATTPIPPPAPAAATVTATATATPLTGTHKQLTPTATPGPEPPRQKRKYTKRANAVRTQTPGGSRASPTAADEASTTPLPTRKERPPTGLSTAEYQSIAESAILSASLHRSRMQWLCHGIFKKYWVKPYKRKGVVEAPLDNPDAKSMHKLGSATVTIEPHTFDAVFYTVRDPVAAQPYHRHPNQHTAKHAARPTPPRPMHPPPVPYLPRPAATGPTPSMETSTSVAAPTASTPSTPSTPIAVAPPAQAPPPSSLPAPSTIPRAAGSIAGDASPGPAVPPTATATATTTPPPHSPPQQAPPTTVPPPALATKQETPPEDVPPPAQLTQQETSPKTVPPATPLAKQEGSPKTVPCPPAAATPSVSAVPAAPPAVATPSPLIVPAAPLVATPSPSTVLTTPPPVTVPSGTVPAAPPAPPRDAPRDAPRVPPPGPPSHPPGGKGSTSDPVIQMLAARAASNTQLKELMKVVATSKASPEQLKEFQAHIDELTEIVRRQEAERMAKAGDTKPAERPVATLARSLPASSSSSSPPQKPGDVGRAHSTTAAGVARPPTHAPPAQMATATPPTLPTPPAAASPRQSVPPAAPPVPGAMSGVMSPFPPSRTPSAGPMPPMNRYMGYPPTPVPRPEPVVKHIVMELTNAPSATQSASPDRWLFPEHAVLEIRYGGLEMICSFLVVRTGAEIQGRLGVDGPSDDAGAPAGGWQPDQDYYQPVTMMIRATHHRTIETIARAAKSLPAVQDYMTGVMAKKLRAPTAYLVHQLPRGRDRDRAAGDGADGGFVDSGVEVGPESASEEGEDEEELKDVYGI